MELRFFSNQSTVSSSTSTAGLTRLLCGTSLFESVPQIANSLGSSKSVHYFSVGTDESESNVAVFRSIPRHLLPVCANGAPPNPYLALFGLAGTLGCADRLRDMREYEVLLLLRHARGRLTARGLRTESDRVLLRPEALRKCRLRFLHPEDQHARSGAPLLVTTMNGDTAQPFDVSFDRVGAGGLASQQSHPTSTRLTAEQALAKLVFVRTQQPPATQAPSSTQHTNDPAFVQFRADPANCEIKRFFPDLRAQTGSGCFSKLVPPNMDMLSADSGYTQASSSSRSRSGSNPSQNPSSTRSSTSSYNPGSNVNSKSEPKSKPKWSAAGLKLYVTTAVLHTWKIHIAPDSSNHWICRIARYIAQQIIPSPHTSPT